MLLSNILANGQQAIAVFSATIATGLLKLDATGVNYLTSEEIEALFSGIPIDFDLEQIFTEKTVSDRLNAQVTDYINRRPGKKVKSVKEALSSDNISSIREQDPIINTREPDALTPSPDISESDCNVSESDCNVSESSLETSESQTCTEHSRSILPLQPSPDIIPTDIFSLRGQQPTDKSGA